jgi:alpha-L-fucosidase
VTPGSAAAFSIISIREPIELGERTAAYHIEIKQEGAWNRTPLDAFGTVIAGTVIGQRQLWQVNPTTAETVALVIDSARDVPAIAEFGLY